MGGPAGQRVWNSSPGAWRYSENHLAAFQICWCRAAKHDRCPLNILSSSLHPAKAWFLIHILMFSVAFSLTHTRNTCRHTHVRRAGSSSQRAAGSTAFLGSGFILQLHLGWSPTAPRNPREPREALLASTPTSFPALISTAKGDQDPVP